ncbi:Ig-like domain-containing protein [Flavobacterium tiangeerense]|uniref:Ig-like domain-containing protein n=1 Tax=Flavobacterium tiangeerense TaxID=459471 RepID=A0ABY3FML1_9FLAO|nr:Ig-like domain-containing protein [Flavobacterium tiangeerense]TWI01433.1 Ig-like domain-containing protein [Flavobacterium tiangeerense]
MLKNNLKYTFFLFLIILASCAKRGTITGGLKDTIAPILKVSFPKNFSTNFTGNKIQLVFDENIKLKNLNKQLIISPPMKNEPLIIPTTPTKTITITLKDTLQPNTTYSLNFGQSIADNNEENPLNQFKYVFSTGATIDSLQLGGTIKIALDKEVESFVSVMLYDVNDKFNDSVIYKQNPRYITNTLDSLKSFKLENLKAGKYLLVALKDYNNNNKFDPKKDKIGFVKEFISVPNDTLYKLEIFKEELPFKAIKPVQAAGNKLIMGYEGTLNNLKDLPKITLKDNTTEINHLVTKFPKKDSLQIWYKPIKTDSLKLFVKKDKYETKFSFKIKDQKKDTLNITPLQMGDLKFREQFTLETSTPLINIANEKITLLDKNKKSIPFKTEYDEYNQRLYFDFKKEPSENYVMTVLPEAFTDFFEKKNDTLMYKFSTRNTSEYGNLSINLQKAKSFPVLIELTNAKGDVLASEYTTENSTVNFNLIEPAQYTLRATYDSNKNGKWDPGDFLNKLQAEEVIYFSKEIDVRANWDVNQLFDLSIPYTPEIKKKAANKKQP